MKSSFQPLVTLVGFLCGVSLHKVFFQHKYMWLFMFIPTLVFTIWYFYKLFKEK